MRQGPRCFSSDHPCPDVGKLYPNPHKCQDVPCTLPQGPLRFVKWSNQLDLPTGPGSVLESRDQVVMGVLFPAFEDGDGADVGMACPGPSDTAHRGKDPLYPGWQYEWPLDTTLREKKPG